MSLQLPDKEAEKMREAANAFYAICEKGTVFDRFYGEASDQIAWLHKVREENPERFEKLNNHLQGIRPSNVVYLQREFAKYHNPNKEANSGSKEETPEGGETTIAGENA